MEIAFKLVAAIAAAITAGINMFRTTARSTQKALPVIVGTHAAVNIREDVTIFYRIENLTDQQIILTGIHPIGRKNILSYGPSADAANSLEDYVVESMKSRRKTIGIDRFFPSRIAPNLSTYGYVVLSGIHHSVKLKFGVQIANEKTIRKIAHQVTLSPPLAVAHVISPENG